MTTIFYTAVIGSYDDLPTFSAFDAQARYVCFSDTVDEAPHPWEIAHVDPYFADNKVTSGFLKSNAHLLFPPDCVVVWVDANLKDIALSPLEALDLLDDHSIAVLPHRERHSVAAEARVVAEWDLDYPSRIAHLLQSMSDAGFPDDEGLAATGLLIRDLRDPRVSEFNRHWWDGIARLSRRDQLTFTYSLWKSGLRATPIPVDYRTPNRLFSRVDHGPLAEAERPIAASQPSSADQTPDLLEPRMPDLPAHHPRTRIRHGEVWERDTLTLLHRLNHIVSTVGQSPEGNCYHFHGATVTEFTPPDPRLSWKREFMRQAVRPARAILQVGFGAGHSAAIALGSSSDLHLVAIDRSEHSYTRRCAQAVLDEYQGRFESLWDSSCDVLAAMPAQRAAAFDLVSIDGGHSQAVFASALGWFLSHTRPGCRLLVDDCYAPHARELLERACQDGQLCEVATEIPSSGENRLYALIDRPIV